MRNRVYTGNLQHYLTFRCVLELFRTFWNFLVGWLVGWLVARGFHWFACVFIDWHWFSLICIWFSLISVDFFIYRSNVLRYIYISHTERVGGLLYSLEIQTLF